MAGGGACFSRRAPTISGSGGALGARVPIAKDSGAFIGEGKEQTRGARAAAASPRSAGQTSDRTRGFLLLPEFKRS
jgi:hypothetical protein